MRSRHTSHASASSHKVAPGEIAIGVIIGRSSEFFDFFVYAIASVLVFPKLFFSNFDPLTGTLYSFAIFALAFVARPVGSVIFMAIDRSWGKGIKLTIALFLLGSSTVAIALVWRYCASARAWRSAAPGTASHPCWRFTHRTTGAAGMR
jgi:MFS family permease